MLIHIPYTYLIGWSAHNKWYYGVRFAKKCNPNDLWKKYFTSSKYVKDFRLKHGEPDVIQVRKTFTDSESAILWEEKVLKRLRVLNKSEWFNKNISGAIAPMFGTDNYMFGKTHSIHVKEQLRKANIGKKASAETKLKQSRARLGRPGHKCSDKTKKKISSSRLGKYAGEDNHFFGKKHTDEVKAKISQMWKGTKRSAEQKEMMSKRMSGENHPLFGKPCSDERKRRISESAKNNARKTCCVVCRKETSFNNHVRWHFNCSVESIDG